MHILHIDSSARPGRSGTDPHGSHTRRLSDRFMTRWRRGRPNDDVRYRDLSLMPPSPVTGAWIASAFTPVEHRDDAANACLAESDLLVDELLWADLVLIGAPMYNFGIPSTLKAWIDNIVRVGLTFGFDRSREGDPYWPMLEADKRLIIVSSRGDYGYGPGERLADKNLVEKSIQTPLAYLGLTTSHSVAIEYDEFSDQRLARSIDSAERAIDLMVDGFLNEYQQGTREALLS